MPDHGALPKIKALILSQEPTMTTIEESVRRRKEHRQLSIYATSDGHVQLVESYVHDPRSVIANLSLPRDAFLRALMNGVGYWLPEEETGK